MTSHDRPLDSVLSDANGAGGTAVPPSGVQRSRQCMFIDWWDADRDAREEWLDVYGDIPDW